MRLPVNKQPHELEDGEYAYWAACDHWVGCTPNGLLANLAAHKVVVNDNGSITVTPSIEVHGAPNEYWHGYLTDGEWYEC